MKTLPFAVRLLFTGISCFMLLVLLLNIFPRMAYLTFDLDSTRRLNLIATALILLVTWILSLRLKRFSKLTSGQRWNWIAAFICFNAIAILLYVWKWDGRYLKSVDLPEECPEEMR